MTDILPARIQILTGHESTEPGAVPAAVVVLCPVSPTHLARGYHRHAIGLSHFAIAVASRQLVDDMAAHLNELAIDLLGDGITELGYYTLAFEDPDRIMIEIVCHDPHYFAAAP